jgi:hypothetical protein
MKDKFIIICNLFSKKIDLALGPFRVDAGDRDLVAKPSVVVMDGGITILSSAQSFLNSRDIGILKLTRSFEIDVWYFIILTLLAVIIKFSFIEYIHTKNRNLLGIIATNFFRYSGNLLRQSEKMRE